MYDCYFNCIPKWSVRLDVHYSILWFPLLQNHGFYFSDLWFPVLQFIVFTLVLLDQVNLLFDDTD
jgi:hypothetical protein